MPLSVSQIITERIREMPQTRHLSPHARYGQTFRSGGDNKNVKSGQLINFSDSKARKPGGGGGIGTMLTQV